MTLTPNAEEQSFWSGPSGLSWIEHEAEQDSLLRPVIGPVLAAAGLGAGDRVLDIGCGTGELSLRAAEAVGPAGRVLATDISAPLLARAAKRAAALPQVATHLADAQVAEWPERGFDHAISRFGVMFFSDPAAAFANIARALRPGGGMSFAAWDSAAVNPWWEMPARIAVERLGPLTPTPPNAPGPMGLADADWSLAQFRSAGLEACCERVELFMTVGGGAGAAAELALRIGPAARVLRRLGGGPADAAAIRDRLEDAFAGFATADTARIPARINLYTARVP